MKHLLLLALFSVALLSHAQQKSTLKSLQKVYATQVTWQEPGELTYNEQEKIIQARNFRIPVSKDTHLKFDKRKGNSVIFALQNNTSITDANDPSIKMAYFEMPFKTKDAAVSFITHFNNLIGEK